MLRTRNEIEIVEKDGKKYVKCVSCGKYKELNEKNFYRDNTTTGFKFECKECKKKYYIENREKRLSYQNRYNKEKTKVC